MKPVGSKQRKPSAHKLNEGVPSIRMMDKIYDKIRREKEEQLNRYNSLCGPISISYKTTITTKTSKYKVNS